jgi:hypothetical protein
MLWAIAIWRAAFAGAIAIGLILPAFAGTGSGTARNRRSLRSSLRRHRLGLI